MQVQARVWRTLSFVLLTIAACLRAESTAYADAAARWTDAQLVGFSDVAFLTPADAERRYFLGRTDGLPAPRRVRIARAVK